MRNIFKDKITPVRNIKRAHIYRALLKRRSDDKRSGKEGAGHE